MQRRTFSTLFSALAVLVMLLSACAPQPAAAPAAGEAASAPASGAAGEAAAASEVLISPAGEFPVVSEPITIKAFLCPTSMVKDYKENEFTYWLEDLTGINLEFDIPPMSDAQQKLNLMLASGDLPDVIIGCNIRLDQLQILAEQGVVVPLDDYIAEYGTEFRQVFETFPQVKDLITLADGKIYGLPHINDCYHCSMSQKMWLYQPWLDELGLETPTTTEEFYQVLKAFKEQDPNGNGKADEIPLSGTQRTNGGWHAQLDQFLMNSFVYNDGVTNNNAPSLILEDGTVKAAFTEPGWQEGLIYLNKLYSEGLIDPQVFTNDGNQLRQLGENPDVPILGATSAGWYGVFTQNGGPSGRWKEFTPIAPLTGPSGMRQTPQTPYQPTGGQGNFVITSAAKNPLAAFRMADVFYGFDSTTRSVFGPEGEDWVRAGPDDVSISGGKALYTVLKVWSGEEHNRHWNQAAPTFRTNEYRLAQTYNPDDPLERWLYEWTRDLMEPYGTTDKAVPPMVLTEEQSKLFGELNTTVYNVVDEWFANFVIGNYDINTEWDSYIEALNDSGLEQFLAIYQDAYDAKYK
ncbi:MAG: extracellular solute-binding protein [Caldilineaceae bacterium]|nr:extracellular solute-binding protein [Caldilineaceae bacterium]